MASLTAQCARSAAILSVGTWLAIAPVSAQAAEASPATRTLMERSVGREALDTADGRMALALAVKSYCEEIRRVYPRNSPAEDEWLDDELRSGGERAMRAIDTSERGRRRAKVFTDGCLDWSAALSKEPDRPRYYVGLAYEISRFADDAAYFAKKNSVDADLYAFIILDDAAQALMVAALMTGK